MKRITLVLSTALILFLAVGFSFAGENSGDDPMARLTGDATVTGTAVDLTRNNNAPAYNTKNRVDTNSRFTSRSEENLRNSMQRAALLTADTHCVYDVGGTVNFQLDAGVQYAYHEYLLLGSTTGTSPGIGLPGGNVLPLVWDWFTDLIMQYLNSIMFYQFYGILDGNGHATAQFNLPAPPPGEKWPEMTLWFAYCIKDEPKWIPSNTVQVDLAPELKYPTGYDDPDGTWYDEPYAYDGDPNTAAHFSFPWIVWQWSSWVEFTLPKAYYCDAIWMSAWYSLLYCNMVEIHVWHNGTWIPVHSGGYQDHPIMNKYLIPGGPITVTKARIRFYGKRTLTTPVVVDLFDFIFHIDP
ncbi:MAG: hypothetical protein ABIK28_15800 [Planctomycetota bacterium]